MHEVFLPAIPKGSPQARHVTPVSTDGRLVPQPRRTPFNQDTSPKEMAALQRNYESMSSIVQMCQAELSQVCFAITRSQVVWNPAFLTET